MSIFNRFKGIASRVLLGLTLLITVVLAACILAIYAFREASTEIKTVASELIPQINVSAELGTESINFVNRAATIITANSATELEAIKYQLSDQVSLINRIKQKLKLMVIDQTNLNYFTDIEKEIIENSTSLLKLVAKRINVIKDIDKQLKSLNSIVKNYSYSVDSLFPLVTIDNSNLSEREFKNLLNLWQQSLFASIFISQNVISVKYQSLLIKLKKRFDEHEIKRLNIEESLLEVKAPLKLEFEALNIYAIGSSIFTLREEQLKVNLAIKGILAHHALLSDRLAEFVGDFSHNIRGVALQHSEEISEKLSKRTILLSLGFIAILMIATFVFLYVNHHVVSRIQTLDKKIRGYTKDSSTPKLRAEIDEISQIETSFSFFTNIIQQRELELRKLGEIATEERDKAEAANYSKTRLLTAASHDLRQPLQAMSFFLASMKSHIQSDKGHDLYQSLDSSIKELSKMFNHLLDLSDTTVGGATLNLHHFPLSTVFLRIENEYRPQALGAKINFDVQSTEFIVYSDLDKLYRIVSNLLSNAVLYAPNSIVRVTATECDKKINIMVLDTGPGIDKKHIDDIFADKYRLSDIEGGLGMGLAIANELAQTMGSEIILNHNIPTGAIFELLVEAGNVNAIRPNLNKKKESIGISLHGMNVVVVDDNKQVLTSTLALLESWGCSAEGYNNPNLAMKSSKTFTKNTIFITDLHLGRYGSGLDFLKKIYDINNIKMNAIITSADQSRKSREQAQEMGHRLIRKPIKPSNLAALLRSFKVTFNNENI